MALTAGEGLVPDGALAGGEQAVKSEPNLVAKISADITVTVGSGGDYATINEALVELSKSYPLYKQGGYTAEISLLTGFVMAEQILVCGIDLSWITITSVDAEVVIDRSALSTVFSAEYPAFGATNGQLPVIGALFNMNALGTATDRHGVSVINNSGVVILGGKGVKNAGGRGLSLTNNSTAEAVQAVFSGAGTYGIYSSGISNVTALLADVSGAGTFGIAVTTGGLADASSITGTLSQTANTLTGNGIIFQ